MYSQVEPDYLITYKSPFSVQETTDKLEQTIKENDAIIFSRIDMSQAAIDVGLKMQQTILLIFGNAKAGTPIMIENPAIAIELPLKALIWEEDNQTFVAYHNVTKTLIPYKLNKTKENLEKIKHFLEKVVTQAIA